MTDSCPFLTNVRMNTFPVGNGTMRRKIDFMSASVKLYGNEHLAAHSPPKVNPPALAHYIYILMSKDKLLFFYESSLNLPEMSVFLIASAVPLPGKLD